ncbi:MAG: hypothetical protein CSA66_06345, partial [Proteobacteria bacterium]
MAAVVAPSADRRAHEGGRAGGLRPGLLARAPGAGIIAAMELTQALAGRRSERHFSDEPVPAEVISALIGVASHAPSAGNRQPWRVAAVAPAAARAIIDDLEPKAWEILYPTLREVIASDPTVLGRA